MSLILPFDSDDPEFTRGVELGIIYAQLDALPTEATTYERTIHTSNLEMLLRVAERGEWALRPEAASDETGATYDEWTVIHLTRVPREPGMAAPESEAE